MNSWLFTKILPQPHSYYTIKRAYTGVRRRGPSVGPPTELQHASSCSVGDQSAYVGFRCPQPVGSGPPSLQRRPAQRRQRRVDAAVGVVGCCTSRTRPAVSRTHPSTRHPSPHCPGLALCASKLSHATFRRLYGRRANAAPRDCAHTDAPSRLAPVEGTEQTRKRMRPRAASAAGSADPVVMCALVQEKELG